MTMISVIVPTYNRAHDLKDTLDCLINQETNNAFNYEIIVVDNNSKDNTQQVLASYASGNPELLRCMFEARQGKSYALNTAIGFAKGEIISFVDDDCLLEKNYLWNIHRAFESHGPQIGILGGKISPKWIGDKYPFWLDKLFTQPAKLEDGSFNWLKISFEGVLGILDWGKEPFILDYTRKDHPDLQFFGANMAFRKENLERCGGFGTGQKTGEDTYICERLFNAGVKGIYAPDVEVYHKTPTSKGTPGFFYQWWFGRGIDMDLQEKYMMALLIKAFDNFKGSFREKDLFKKVRLRWRAFFNLGQMTKLLKQTFA